MRPKGSNFRKCQAALRRLGRRAWMFLTNRDRRPLTGFDVAPDAVPEEPSLKHLSSLERITEHLRDHGLGQRVHARVDEAGGGFVLEDADGSVHAKDYNRAVVMIERIWLYQP